MGRVMPRVDANREELCQHVVQQREVLRHVQEKLDCWVARQLAGTTIDSLRKRFVDTVPTPVPAFLRITSDEIEVGKDKD